MHMHMLYMHMHMHMRMQHTMHMHMHMRMHMHMQYGRGMTHDRGVMACARRVHGMHLGHLILTMPCTLTNTLTLTMPCTLTTTRSPVDLSVARCA